jgi:hypothetical protein
LKWRGWEDGFGMCPGTGKSGASGSSVKPKSGVQVGLDWEVVGLRIAVEVVSL